MLVKNPKAVLCIGGQMEKLTVGVHTIPEREYLEHLKAALAEIPKDGTFAMLGLRRKNGSYADPFEDAPKFLFSNTSNFDYEDIMEYAETLSMESFVLPGLKMQFLLATGPKEEFDFLMDLPEDAILNEDFRTIVKKYKEFFKCKKSATA